MDDQQEMTQEEALAHVQAMINPVEQTPHDPIPTKVGAGANAQQAPQEPQAQGAQPEAKEAGPQRGPENTNSGAQGDSRGDDETAAQRYNRQVERLLAQNREAVQKRQEHSGKQEDLELAQRLLQAKKYGPEAVLKELGLESPQPKEPDYDIRKLLGLDDEEDDSNKSVSQLEAKMAKLEDYIKKTEESLAQKEQERLQREEQDNMWRWEAQEYRNIQNFLTENQSKYEYVNSLKDLGSEQDIFNGIIGMYRQGIEPSYGDVADLVETRVEALAETLINTPKFQKLLEQKGIKVSPQLQKPSKTLTGSMIADSSSHGVEQAEESDEDNQRRSLQAALAAKESAEAALKQRLSG